MALLSDSGQWITKKGKHISFPDNGLLNKSDT